MFEIMGKKNIIFSLLLSSFYVGLWSQSQAQVDVLPDQEPIVRIEEKVDHQKKKISLEVRDMNKKELIPFYSIDFSSCGHPTYESDEKGLFSMTAFEGFDCFVMITKEGFSPMELRLDYNEIAGAEKIFQIFLSRSPNYYQGVIRDQRDQHKYLDNAKVEIVSLDDHQIQKVESDPHGAFSIYLHPNTDYMLSIEKSNYHQLKKKIRTGDFVDPSFMSQLYLEPNFKKISDRISGPDMSVNRKSKRANSAKKSSYYSIQIKASSASEIDLEPYQDALAKYGDVYIDIDKGISKIKVGKYFDRDVAYRVLEMIRSDENYADAFLTQFIQGNQSSKPASPDQNDASKFLIRLATYQHPELFDKSKVVSFGSIIEIKKEAWTIFLIEGFDDLEVAKKVQKQVQAVGFKTAQIVVKQGDVLKKVY